MTNPPLLWSLVRGLYQGLLRGDLIGARAVIREFAVLDLRRVFFLLLFYRVQGASFCEAPHIEDGGPWFDSRSSAREQKRNTRERELRVRERARRVLIVFFCSLSPSLMELF